MAGQLENESYCASHWSWWVSWRMSPTVHLIGHGVPALGHWSCPSIAGKAIRYAWPTPASLAGGGSCFSPFGPLLWNQVPHTLWLKAAHTCQFKVSKDQESSVTQCRTRAWTAGGRITGHPIVCLPPFSFPFISWTPYALAHVSSALDRRVNGPGPQSDGRGPVSRSPSPWEL